MYSNEHLTGKSEAGRNAAVYAAQHGAYQGFAFQVVYASSPLFGAVGSQCGQISPWLGSAPTRLFLAQAFLAQALSYFPFRVGARAPEAVGSETA